MLIDHIYSTVQILLNKNTKGTLTPERFNELCRMAINDMFMNLTNEKRKYENRRSMRRGGTRKQEVDKALSRYMERSVLNDPPTAPLASSTIPVNFAMFPDKYIFYSIDDDIDNLREIPEIPNDNFGAYTQGIAAPSELYPQHKIYDQAIHFKPALNHPIVIMYYRYPNVPNWTYTVVDGEPIFNPSDPSFVDADIYEQRSQELIDAILVLAGLSIKEQLSIQVGGGMKQQDEGQNDSV